jgi:hypothetical protein
VRQSHNSSAPRPTVVRLHPESIERIALRVAVLLARRPSERRAPEEPHLLTASEVSKRYRVHRGWVYAHAQELGAIPIGDGTRPRLRFDASQVARRLRHPDDGEAALR